MTVALLDHPYIRELIGLELPVEDFVIAGSGPLLARGLIEKVGDLDVVARGDAWSRALTLGIPGDPKFGSLPQSGDVAMLNMPGTHVEVFNGWFPGIWSVDDLIDSAEFYAGLPFVPLSIVVKTKRLLDREIDRGHLFAIDEWCGNEPLSNLGPDARAAAARRRPG